MTTNPFDAINQSTYGRPQVVDVYRNSTGFTDAGEEAALRFVTEEARDKPILDIGVGGGRTVEMLRALSRDYTAVDYTPALAAACRARYPSVRVEIGDARDLVAFADASYFMVTFSFNGIDSVAHADRIRILKQMHRVLVPGGLCWFSTHNYDGPGRAPVRFVPPSLRMTKNPLRLAVRVAKLGKLLVESWMNRRQHSRFDVRDEDYCMVNSGAHDYGLMIHHTRLEPQLRQLIELGFSPDIAVFDSVNGRRVQVGDDTSRVGWFHLVARKQPG